MFESMGIRLIVGLVVIITGFMVLQYLNAGGKEKMLEYAAPVKKAKSYIKSILKKGNTSRSQPGNDPRVDTSRVQFAPSAIDGTMSEFGAWDTNRNSGTGIMNQLGKVDHGSSGSMSNIPAYNAPNMLPSVPLLDGFEASDDFGADL